MKERKSSEEQKSVLKEMIVIDELFEKKKKLLIESWKQKLPSVFQSFQIQKSTQCPLHICAKFNSWQAVQWYL